MPTQGQAKRRSAIQPADKPAKRTRVSRACDQCRAAREKCDGLQPVCSTCQTSKRKCTYTANPKKRGIQPGYIRTLELALAWLFQDNPESETSLNDKLAREGAYSLFLSRDSKESNRLHKRWRKARFYTDVDKLLSGGEPSRHDNSEAFSQSDDDESNAERVAADDDQNQGSSAALQAKVRLSRPWSQQPTLSSQHPPKDTTIVFLPPDSWKLLENYFTYTQCWLPICEKHDILKTSYSYPVEGLSHFSIHEDSSAHAELWSILAVASLHDSNHMESASQSDPALRTPEQLYEVARSLVPGELGSFETGHVKALLNLAIFNIMQSLHEAAWVLVGYASRLLEVLDQSKLKTNPRKEHVLSGCFLLDSMLALQLRRRPFRKYNFELLGKIAEDGLEEWQPWDGHFHASLLQQPRAPTLALSTFNNLLDLVDILNDSEASSVSFINTQGIHNRLQRWKTSLPSKLHYIFSTTASVPLTPPAALLLITYYCTALAARPSEPRLSQLLEILEQYQERIGFTSLPPSIKCLMTVINKHISHLTLDETTRIRLQSLQSASRNAWPTRLKDRDQTQGSLTTAHSTRLLNAIQMEPQDPSHVSYTTDASARDNDTYVASTQFGTLPLVQHTMVASDQPFDPLLIPVSPAQPNPRYQDFTESFFDDLASLDSAPKVTNQPQFMQNLGFAPDANIADLFSEYIPSQSSAFLPGEDSGTGAVNFSEYNFYDAI